MCPGRKVRTRRSNHSERGRGRGPGFDASVVHFCPDATLGPNLWRGRTLILEGSGDVYRVSIPVLRDRSGCLERLGGPQSPEMPSELIPAVEASPGRTPGAKRPIWPITNAVAHGSRTEGFEVGHKTPYPNAPFTAQPLPQNQN